MHAILQTAALLPHPKQKNTAPMQRNICRSSIPVLASFMILICGCDSTTLNQVSEPAVREVLSMSGKDQRLAFSLLTPEERAQAWQLRFDTMNPAIEEALSKNEDPVRQELINEFINFINTPGLYEGDGNHAPDSRVSAFFGDWYARAKGHLSDVEAFNLTHRLTPLMSLSDTTGLPFAESDGSGKVAATSCDGCCCHRDSWFTCPEFSLSWGDFGLSWGECEGGSPCSNSGMGCGGAFLWACNGDACYN